MEGREPKVAFVAIINKKVREIISYNVQNKPIILRNFLTEAMKTNFTELTGEEIASLDQQMKMLVYQTLDHFDDK